MTDHALARQKAHAAISNLEAALQELEHDDEMAAYLLDKAGTKVYGALLALDRLDIIDDRPRWLRVLTSRFVGSSPTAT